MDRSFQRGFDDSISVIFLLRRQRLYLLLPRYCGFYVRRLFVVGEPGEVVLASKASHEFGLVLVHSFFEVVGHSDVESSGPVGQYVNVVLSGVGCGHGTRFLGFARNDMRACAWNDMRACARNDMWVWIGMTCGCSAGVPDRGRRYEGCGGGRVGIRAWPNASPRAPARLRDALRLVVRRRGSPIGVGDDGCWGDGGRGLDCAV